MVYNVSPFWLELRDHKVLHDNLDQFFILGEINHLGCYFSLPGDEIIETFFPIAWSSLTTSS